MKKFWVSFFATLVVIPTFFNTNAAASNFNAALVQTSEQTTGQVVVRRRRHGPVRRTVNRGYRGGKYVAHKSWQGGKYVASKSVKGSKYVAHKSHRTGRKVVSRTKKLVQ
jgi:hypothetical protein